MQGPFFKPIQCSTRTTAYGRCQACATAEARKFELDCPPTPKQERRQTRPALIFLRPCSSFFGVYCKSTRVSLPVPWCLRTKYQQLDVLVNNAAIAFKAADPTPFQDQTVPTLLGRKPSWNPICSSFLGLVMDFLGSMVWNPQKEPQMGFRRDLGFISCKRYLEPKRM